MTSVWSETGVRMPVTVLQLEDVIVTDIRTEEKHGYTALQVGCSPKKEKNTPKPMIEHFKTLGVHLRQKLYQFKVSKDAVLPIGTELTADHFVTGQFVNVTAPSIGKGFAGVMTWNFKGLPASHGVSLTIVLVVLQVNVSGLVRFSKVKRWLVVLVVKVLQSKV
ncbi:unnamed protein product [Mucor hiemalis]